MAFTAITDFCRKHLADREKIRYWYDYEKTGINRFHLYIKPQYKSRQILTPQLNRHALSANQNFPGETSKIRNKNISEVSLTVRPIGVYGI